MIPNKPSGVQWTDQQWRAIYVRNKNVLVSAGAGSGKTAVLTERVFQRIKEGVDVNRLLVVTFTKAAALEMKERIRNRLIKAVEAGDDSLYTQLNLLEVAQISTFDSFSLNIVQRFGSFIGVNATVQIGDAVALEKLKREMLDQFIAEQFKNPSPEFIALLKRYTIKHSTPIKDMIFELTEDLLKRPDFTNILSDDLNRYHDEKFYDMLLKQHAARIAEEVATIRYMLSLMYDHFTLPSLLEYAEKIEASLSPLFDKAEHDVLHAFFTEYKFPRLPTGAFNDEDGEDAGVDRKQFENIRETIKDAIKAIKDYVKDPVSVLKARMDDNHPYELTLLKLTKAFIERYFSVQKELNYFDFNSMATMSIQLLREYPEIRDTLQQSYAEILVDEYQDTSPLQNGLIDLIAHNNLYVVGDIKQSIYRFRDADPKIFRDKYYRYLDAEDTGEVIHLNENFRSRQEIIADINTVFDVIFDERLGGVNYRLDQQLVYGLKKYEEEAILSQPYGITFMQYDQDDLNQYKDLWPHKHVKQMTAHIDCQLIAKDILDKVDQNTKTFDKDTQTLRSCRYDDFVILIDRKTYFDAFQETFQAFGIPLHVHKQDIFLSNTDVLVTVNLFKLLGSLMSEPLAERYFKHAFLSVAYSYLFDYSQDEIVAFMTKLDTLSPEHIFKQAEGTVFAPLFSVFADLLDKQLYLRLSDILHVFNQAFDLTAKALKLDNVAAIEERLIYIFEQLKGFDSQQFTLEDLVAYYTFAIENHQPSSWFFNIDIDYVRGTAVVKDKVNIMTIHKSKGLEFPFVYCANTFAGWQWPSEQARFSETYGLLIPAFDEGLVATLAAKLDFHHNKLEEASERMRLFYVALSRAREHMCLIHTPTDKHFAPELYETEDGIVHDAFRRAYASYRDVVQSVLKQFPYRHQRVYLTEEHFLTRSFRMDEEDLLATTYEGSLYTYDPVTPSEVETPEVPPVFEMDLPSPETQKNMALGTRVHALFKYLDFKAPLAPQLEKFNVSEPIKSHITAFFKQKWFEDIQDAKVLKEHPFIRQDGDETWRGVIDLLIEYPHEMIIIDYKMKNLDDPRYHEQVMKYVDTIYHKTHKPTSGFLYSIVTRQVKTIVNHYKGR